MDKKSFKISKSTLLSKILFLFLISMTGILGNAWANVCPVGSETPHTTIQSAINDSRCDQVQIPAGMYVENIYINRNIELEGEPGVIIYGNGLEPTVSIAGSVTVTISNVSVQNGADLLWYGAVGGGIHIELDATVILKTVEVTNNKAFSGGGIRNKGNLTLQDNSKIKGNIGYYSGGGIFNECKGTLLVKNSSILSNETYGLGGGVLYCGHVTLTNGAVVSYNKAAGGGGLSYQYAPGIPSSLTVDNSTISNNEASLGGGGIFSSAALKILNGSTISNNKALANLGGGIVHTYQAFTLQDSTVTNNTSGKDGGGLHLTSHLNFIENSQITNNLSPANGGGIYHGQSGALHVLRSTISGNSAARGGGFFSDEETMSPSDLLEVTHSTISDNTASDGAGIYTLRPFTFLNSTISTNQAAVSGGGLFLGPTYSLIQNSTFSANSAKAGGGLYLEGNSTEVAQANIHNTTVYENSANYGGGIGYLNATIALNHTLIAHAGGTPGEDCYEGTGGTLTSEGHNLDSDDSCGLDAPGDLPDSHPGLEALADNGGYTMTHRLNNHSEAKNAGDTTCGTSVDQRDKVRPVNNFCDIGAFEEQ